MTFAPSRFAIADEVAHALATNGAVVALETTVVTHGLPHPAGVDTALELEACIRSTGAVPASIGILDGAIRVGLTRAELHTLAGASDVAKVNLSNIAAVLAARGPGSTTVAATLFAAAQCGIRVFATGGIGGVHREVVDTGDVSGDLTALARFPVAVVSAGAKAILDLPRTIEALETLGVPIFGWRTDEFPAFYRRTSGQRVDFRFDDMALLAAAVSTHFTLGLGTGILIANPIPEADEIALDVYHRALTTALADAGAQAVQGRAVTPFLLERMRELTGGASVTTNVALLKHNALVAAQLAIALSAIAQR
jgi:pseudouridine-5'-phosphate glycosidase